MSYIYETHLHTSEASACGKVPGKDYIPYMKSRGYDGMIVTDHFFNGNSAVPKDLPWKQRVEWYCSGYEHARQEAEKTDFTVLFGVEYYFDEDEYLIYGIDREWLLENEDIMQLSRQEVYVRVHEGGGIMVQAHPYRERRYMTTIRLTPSVCDGVEVFNGANGPGENALAYAYAKELGVPMSAGSDIHFFSDHVMGGMRFKQRIETIADYAAAFQKGEGTPVLLAEDKVIPACETEELLKMVKKPTFPVVIMD